MVYSVNLGPKNNKRKALIRPYISSSEQKEHYQQKKKKDLPDFLLYLPMEEFISADQSPI